MMFRELKGKKEAASIMLLRRKDKICAKNNRTLSSGLSLFRGLSEVYLGLCAKCRIFAHF
jgi:hypothetical protein